MTKTLYVMKYLSVMFIRFSTKLDERIWEERIRFFFFFALLMTT
jgi:hypothetical protein